jgi:hypothetical protein
LVIVQCKDPLKIILFLFELFEHGKRWKIWDKVGTIEQMLKKNNYAIRQL